jgi:hypothetical protein
MKIGRIWVWGEKKWKKTPIEKGNYLLTIGKYKNVGFVAR